MTQEELGQMQKFTEQIIRNTAVHVKNNTEKTNSSLVAEIMHKIEKELDPAIKKHVNGQFDRFREEFKDYVEKDTLDKEAILKWQKDVAPSIEVMKKFQGFTSTSGWILKGILLTGGVIGMVWGAFVFIKNQIKHL